MKAKMGIIVLVLILIGVGVAYYATNKANPASTPGNSGGQQSQTSQPKFVYGEVKSVSATSLVFDNDGEKTANFTAATPLVKQSKDAKGLIALQSAALSDFKPGKHIFVYYDIDPSNGVYQAVKLQVID